MFLVAGLIVEGFDIGFGLLCDFGLGRGGAALICVLISIMFFVAGLWVDGLGLGLGRGAA
jgi:hypothetical protein